MDQVQTANNKDQGVYVVEMLVRDQVLHVRVPLHVEEENRADDQRDQWFHEKATVHNHKGAKGEDERTIEERDLLLI